MSRPLFRGRTFNGKLFASRVFWGMGSVLVILAACVYLIYSRARPDTLNNQATTPPFSSSTTSMNTSLTAFESAVPTPTISASASTTTPPIPVTTNLPPTTVTPICSADSQAKILDAYQLKLAKLNLKFPKLNGSLLGNKDKDDYIAAVNELTYDRDMELIQIHC